MNPTNKGREVFTEEESTKGNVAVSVEVSQIGKIETDRAVYLRVAKLHLQKGSYFCI